MKRLKLPGTFEDTLADLLKVKPPPKGEKPKRRARKRPTKKR
jgi:hypothetical protein